jgi:hypothetical protein
MKQSATLATSKIPIKKKDIVFNAKKETGKHTRSFII